MYDKPYEDLVKREYGEKQFLDFLDQASSVLDSIVNFGSHLFKWSKEVEKMPSDEKLVLLLMLRRALELLDSISILIKTSSVDSSKILTRALLELLFEIAYIIKDESNKKARSFVVWYINEHIKLLQSHENKSPQHEEFIRRIRNDKYLKKMKVPNLEDSGKRIDVLQSILKGYESENEEYQRTRSRRNKFPWYQMFDGPTNTEQLASSVELPGFYEIYFRYFSYTTHSKDIFEGVLKESEISCPELEKPLQ
jgi:hypothetical protein